MSSVLIVFLVWIGLTIPLTFIVARLFSINPRDDD
jgi:hypothetical protein